jgi:hypothetical protein
MVMGALQSIALMAGRITNADNRRLRKATSVATGEACVGRSALGRSGRQLTHWVPSDKSHVQDLRLLRSRTQPRRLGSCYTIV